MRGNGQIRSGKRRQKDDTAAPMEHACQWPGCEDQGVYRAPYSRTNLNQYRWFCLAHVRQYNAAWNYYDGMSEEEVEADVRKDVVWQRPTWRLGCDQQSAAFARGRVRDDFSFFSEGNGSTRHEPRPARTVEERALSVLDLEPPVTVAMVKTRYKKLVKQYHPDANGGDKLAEERFKQISEAYRTVMSCLTS
ncbi:MAG: J domain-containing protein [Hyphomicrobiales bacterium]|nr:J domain-containing protein [Hyphomicrobiales bacterium]